MLRTAVFALILVASLSETTGWLVCPHHFQGASASRLHTLGHPYTFVNAKERKPKQASSTPWTCTTAPSPGSKNEVDLVVLVGFLGCSMPILSKYSAVYEQLGMETVKIIPSVPSMFLAHQGVRGRGSSGVRKLCRQLQEEDRGIILHIFSNNGFIFLCGCLLAAPHLRTRFKGIILDSCPCLITKDVAATGLLSAVAGRDGAEARQSRLLAPLRTMLGPVVDALHGRQEAAWRAWEQQVLLCPHLFLYSEADAVISPREIKQRMEEVGARLEAVGGYRCERRTWEEAAHCGMLRVDPEGYTEAVRDFLDRTVAAERQR